MSESYAYWVEYLKLAKNGHDRPLHGSATKRVLWGSNGEVRLRLHYTDVVTLRADGTEVLRTGGWKTVTTKQFISEHSKAQVWSEKGQWYVKVRHPEITAPKIWKCRQCHGTGKLPQKCYGPSWCYEHHRPGMRGKPCSHGHTWTSWADRAHKNHVCGHGQRGAHPLPATECWQCHGSGRFDYGSKHVHHAWNGEPLLIDTDGYPVGPIQTKPYVPAPRESYDKSGDLLSSVLPGLNHKVTCPHCNDPHGSLQAVIIHLNDGAKWTREHIANWLDTLDVDLTFPVPDQIPAHIH